ncbi:MAG: tetratricopeptide repeat protein, partial [Alphaproteobacteria bacterium]|nr:tetratricopeptide repeat protein [Alphaproteobacteria bacterium]
MPKKILVPLFFSIALLLSACSSPEERAQSHIEAGFAHLAENKPELAGLEFKNALQIDDKLAPAWFGLAQVEERQGRWDKVFGLLNKVVNIDPKHLKAQVQLGKLLLLAGQLDKALEASNTTMKLDPTDATVRALRAATLFKLDDPDGAVELAKSALEADPANVDAVTVLVAERLAAKDIQTAIAYLDQGITRNEKNITLHLVKIQALDAIERKAEAEEVFRRLIKLYPEKTEFRKSLARYYLNQKRYNDAVKEMRALAADHPKDPEIQLDVVRLINTTSGIETAKAEL